MVVPDNHANSKFEDNIADSFPKIKSEKLFEEKEDCILHRCKQNEAGIREQLRTHLEQNSERRETDPQSESGMHRIVSRPAKVFMGHMLFPATPLKKPEKGLFFSQFCCRYNNARFLLLNPTDEIRRHDFFDDRNPGEHTVSRPCLSLLHDGKR